MTQRDESQAGCLVCRQSSDAVPLVAFRFKGTDLWICPQHLPVLIHNPAHLVGILPGAEDLSPADPQA